MGYRPGPNGKNVPLDMGTRALACAAVYGGVPNGKSIAVECLQNAYRVEASTTPQLPIRELPIRVASMALLYAKFSMTASLRSLTLLSAALCIYHGLTR
jgi:hypothetical protein